VDNFEEPSNMFESRGS